MTTHPKKSLHARLGAILIAVYRVQRQRGLSAATSLAIARDEIKASPDKWTEDRNGLPCREWRVGRFLVRVTTEYDQYADLSWLGEPSDKWQPSAILLRDEKPDEYRRSRELRYFIPANTYAARLAYNLRYMSRHAADVDARAGVRKDRDTYLSYGDDWNDLIVIATVYRDGIEMARSSLAGVSVYSRQDWRYITEVAEDCAVEALREARANLRRLCSREGDDNE